MTYTYDPDYLRRNQKLVDELKQIYDRQAVIELDLGSMNEVSNVRNRVRSVLACLSFYHHEYLPMKRAIRTWTIPKPDGTWKLYIGIPISKIRGSVPYQQVYRGAMSLTQAEGMVEESKRDVWTAPKELANVHDGAWFVQTVGLMKDKDEAEAISSMSIEEEPMKTLMSALPNWDIKQEPFRMGQFKITARRRS